jgi:hypothetical protein
MSSFNRKNIYYNCNFRLLTQNCKKLLLLIFLFVTFFNIFSMNILIIMNFFIFILNQAENLYEKYLLNIDISVDKEKLDYKFIER